MLPATSRDRSSTRMPCSGPRLAGSNFISCVLESGMQPLSVDEDGSINLNAAVLDPAFPCNRLDAALARAIIGHAVFRIDVAGELELFRRADLDQEQHDGAVALLDHVAKLFEVLGAALGLGVGEFRHARRAHQMHVLDLDIARRALCAFAEEIHARVLAILSLAANDVVAGKLRDRAQREGRSDQRIGMCGVGADQLMPAAESTSISSQLCDSFRFGLSDFDSHTREPGSASPIIEPGLATCAV